MPRKWQVSAKKLFSKRNIEESSDNDESSSNGSSSSSFVESDDESSSSSSYTSSSSSESSKRSSSSKSVDSSGAKIVKPIKLATIPNFDDSSSGSSEESEFGCGTYRRREDISVSSKSSSRSSSSDDDDDSSSSSSSSQSISDDNDDSSDHDDDDDSSDVSSSSEDSAPSLPPLRTTRAVITAPQKSISEPALNASGLENISRDKKTKTGLRLFKKAVRNAFRKKEEDKVGDVLVPNKLDGLNPSTNSMGSQKSAGSSLLGSSSRRDSSSDEESGSASSDNESSDDSVSSEASSKDVDQVDAKAPPAVETKPKRRSSMDDNGKRPSIDTNKPTRPKSKVSFNNSDSNLKSTLAPSLYDEDQANMIRGRRPSVKTTAAQILEREEADSKKKTINPEASKKAKASWGKLAVAIKHQNEDVDDNFTNMLLQAKKMKEKRRDSLSGSDSDLNNSASKLTSSDGDSNDIFMKVLQQAKEMKEEKRRQSLVGGDAHNSGDSKVQSPSLEGGESRLAKLVKAGVISNHDKPKNGNQSESDEEFQAPKLVHQRPSMRDLFVGDEEDASSESDDSEVAKPEGESRQNRSVGESDEESRSSSSNSSEESEEAFQSNESSDEEEAGESDKMPSDDDDDEQSLSAESQMSILTPIAEESVVTPVDETDNDVDYETSSSGESFSASDLENGNETGDDQSEEEESSMPQSSALDGGKTGEEAMLTDMPDENDVALAKRKAVQNIMKDQSLSAVERNKKIQDIMAGRVELPELSAANKQQSPVEEPANATAADSELTGAEAMLTDLPDENDVALAQRKAIQNVMKDKGLSAVERNRKIQDIMAGRVELPEVSAVPSQDPSSDIVGIPQNGTGAEATTDEEQNGIAKESSSGRRRRKSVQKSEHIDGVANADAPIPVTKGLEPSQMAPRDNACTSNSTMETFESSRDERAGGEMRQRNTTHATSQRDFADNVELSLLQLDQKIQPSNAKNHLPMFQAALSFAESSENKTPDDQALLTAMTCALYDLDSQWDIVTRPLSKSRPVQCTLGKRERISPWSKHLVKNNDAKYSWGDLLEDISPTNKRETPKPRREVKNGTNSNALDDSVFSSVEDSFRSLDAMGPDALHESPKSKETGEMMTPPRMPSKQLIQATFDLKKSAIVQKISDALLHEPFSEHDESEDEIINNLKRSLTASEIKLQRWIKSIHKLDPRWQIRKFFDDASVTFDNAEIFTVWRPTSFDAVAKMMRGEGVGKGLDIKGKSALCGDLSGYVPFLQIDDNDHKSNIRMLKGDQTQIFFKSREARNKVGKILGEKSKEMALKVTKAKFALAKLEEDGTDTCVTDYGEFDAEDLITEIDRYEVTNSEVLRKDKYAPKCYGLEVSCRVLWEGLVVDSDISREPNSKYYTGRTSQPAFQEMNLATLRKQNPEKSIPVLYQYSDDDPLDPRMLIVAYEEEGRVVPVVSDFDCFLIGSRDFPFKCDMAHDQIDLLDWCVSQIEWILDSQSDIPESWTAKWLLILKHAAQNGFVPKMPQFGFGDPSSYALIEAAVLKSKKTNGAVRHGPECFNYFFPQDLDDELLVIFPGEQRWKYVNISELQSILIDKIRQGFTVPLNPKWILCDPGWIDVFIELLKSRRPSVQASVNMWFPRHSGLRERIIDISKRHPEGFRSTPFSDTNMSLAVQEYERFLVLQRAKQKLRGFLALSKLHRTCKEKSANFEKQQRVITLTDVVSARNVAKTLRRKSMVRIEKETVESIRNAVLFDEG